MVVGFDTLVVQIGYQSVMVHFQEKCFFDAWIVVSWNKHDPGVTIGHFVTKVGKSGHKKVEEEIAFPATRHLQAHRENITADKHNIGPFLFNGFEQCAVAMSVTVQI